VRSRSLSRTDRDYMSPPTMRTASTMRTSRSSPIGSRTRCAGCRLVVGSRRANYTRIPTRCCLRV
jgi:hypothetical protein